MLIALIILLGLGVSSLPPVLPLPVSSLAALPALKTLTGRPLVVARPTPARTPLTLHLTVTAPEPVLRGGAVWASQVQRRYPLSLSPAQLTTLLTAAVPTARAPGGPLEALYRQIEARVPRDARFVPDSAGGWTAQAQTGWTVQRADTGAALLRALRRGQREVPVTLTLTPPARTVWRLRAAGVLGHIGSGESGFTGSPAARVHNIRVGSARLDGLLLAPAQTLDFNRQIGRISAARGFVPGYVISGNTLSLEDGGGICQVSSTLFRAAYAAGLPIVERHAHSHQVAYYDPPGFEATVYAPSKNFRFQNDQPGTVLVQAAWDLKRQTLRFDLFGAERRAVVISAPQISRLMPARPPGFMPDAALQPGQAVRVDMPAPGMQVVIARSVLTRGSVRRDETRSRYRPWGGVFAVHPRDVRLK